jgi:hypothetical protein
MYAITRTAHYHVVALGLAACASGTGRLGRPFDNRTVEPARIDIINHNFNDATVWAVSVGEQVRLGTVTGKTTSQFQLPARLLLHPVFMRIDLIGGTRCETDPLTVDNGDLLQLEIAINTAVMSECAAG